MNSSNADVQIKGGGRGVLGEETEEELVQLLIKLRGLNVPESKHGRQRECKRFVKRLVAQHERLVAQHERQAAYDAVNQGSNANDRVSENAVASSTTTTSAAAGLPPVEGKVRIELAEADFSKSSAKQSFKVGSKKVMVVPRATTASELCERAKATLRMKKLANYVFVIPEKGLQVPIEADLRGIKDGCMIYVAVQTQNTTVNKEEETHTEATTQGDEDDEMVDPLEEIKQAYRKRAAALPSRKRKLSKQYSDDSYMWPEESELPTLSEEQSSLPAASQRGQVLRALQNHRVVIISGETGSGKSTQVPQYLDQSMNGSANILVTQPRRVAATALATRVADEMKCPKPGRPGSVVGYRVRLDHAVSETSRIVYCTVGILLRMLICPQQEQRVDSDDGKDLVPLHHLSHLVIDEVHERDWNTDFCLTLLRTVLLRNKTIRVILMSATASSELFQEYFAAFSPQVIDIPGKMYPVEIKWLQDCEKFAGLQLKGLSPSMKPNAIDQDKDVADKRICLSPRAAEKIDDDFIARLIQRIVAIGENVENNESPGAVLVFLPGKAEIESLVRKIRLNNALKGICHAVRLHSAASQKEQESAFLPPPPGKIKVICATNIAETSITIPDVKHVIDTGRVKESRFNASTRIKELVTVWSSKASAKQRCGRAGRTAAGTCWRLYSEKFSNRWIPDQTPPEIIRTPLDEVILQICLLYEERRSSAGSVDGTGGVCPISFLGKAPEPPPVHSLVEGCQHLVEVGALSVMKSDQGTTYRLTPLGYHLSRLPMDAKLGKVLLVGCILDCLGPALTVVAALSSAKSIFLNRSGRAAADDVDWKASTQRRDALIENGYGGKNWKGGTVKGDMIATIAVYDAWSRQPTFRDQLNFAISHALDNRVLLDIKALRKQFKDYLLDAGFLRQEDDCNAHRNDARLASCCLVAGLYPNIATLMRPRREKGRLTMKGGRLITKSGEMCRPSSSSFQALRVKNASESGRDAYAVFHSKHRTVGTNPKVGEVFLSEVNFVSRYALMLFGGDLQIRKNALIVDGWLKFKIGDDQRAGAVLIKDLRREIDAILLRHMEIGSTKENVKQECEDVLNFVRTLLSLE